MNRRDFVKAFAATSIAVPVAAQLAKIPDTEKVIETFQVDEMEEEVNSRDIRAASIIVLCQHYSNLRDYIVQNRKSIELMGLRVSSFKGVTRREQILGMKRGISVMGLYSWYFNAEVVQTAYMREFVVLNPRQYFKTVDLNNLYKVV